MFCVPAWLSRSAQQRPAPDHLLPAWVQHLQTRRGNLVTDIQFFMIPVCLLTLVVTAFDNREDLLLALTFLAVAVSSPGLTIRQQGMLPSTQFF